MNAPNSPVDCSSEALMEKHQHLIAGGSACHFQGGHLSSVAWTLVPGTMRDDGDMAAKGIREPCPVLLSRVAGGQAAIRQPPMHSHAFHGT